MLAASGRNFNAAQHGAALGRNNGANLSSATEIGVNNIKNSVPDAIAATPQATDGHLADMIQARLPVAIVKPPSKGHAPCPPVHRRGALP